MCLSIVQPACQISRNSRANPVPATAHHRLLLPAHFAAEYNLHRISRSRDRPFFMKKPFLKPTILAGSVLAAALSAFAAPATEKNSPGGIVFLGDSITNGGNYLAGPVASFRYRVFKAFVDNGVKFEPMGMTRGAAWATDVSALTPPYRGVEFENVSEAAASGRAYQYAGHGPEKTSSGNPYKPDPQTAQPPQNRGPVSLKLGLPNTFVKDKKAQQDSFYDGTELKKYSGDTYAKLYKNKKVQTLCILIGINDLYDAWESNEEIIEHVHNIVTAYQKHNPAVRVHVFELLPTGANNSTGTHHKNNYTAYNADLRKAVKNWSKGNSVVTCDDISQGFYAEDGSMIDTDRGAHPNAQGELIVAGNITRVLGVGQRTVGLKRKAASELALRAEFSGGNAPKISVGRNAVFDGPADASWKADTGGKLFISAPTEGTSDARTLWKNLGAPAGVSEKNARSVAIKVKMLPSGRNDNFLGIICGNGTSAGILLIGESGIFWNDTKTLLYGSKSTAPAAKIFTKNPVEIRLVCKPEDETAGGFYVWLGSQLIGEALAASPTAEIYRDSFLFGDISNSCSVSAAVETLAFDAKNAHAPAENAVGAPAASHTQKSSKK